MKNLKFVFLMFMAISLASLISCNKEEVEEINTLIGTWSYTIEFGELIEMTITFNEDYTGIVQIEYTDEDDYTEVETDNFTYSVSENELTLVIDGETEVTTFSISGNTLTIYADGEIIVLTKQ
ncbi:MAG: hypothetical protein GQ525_03240 [Draconibacterium sp.]|nr:hypothetical protein [Draconibacterium sp.]